MNTRLRHVITVAFAITVVTAFRSEAMSVDNLTVATNITQTSASGTVSFQGDVGIGTTSPGHELEVVGDIESTGTQGFYATGAYGGLWFNESRTIGISRSSSDGVQIRTGNCDYRLCVTSSGYVGVGISTPAYPLEVKKDVAGGESVVARFTNGRSEAGTTSSVELRTFDRASRIKSIRTGNNEGTDMAFFVDDTAAGDTPTERMRIVESGNVGIGTNTPSETCHVAGTLRADQGITYIPALGDLSMGTYTNQP